MNHTCKAALVRCMDFRLERAIENYVKEKELLDQVDIISLAGGAKDINDQSMGGAIQRQLQLSKDLHHITTVILMNHTDCGGYGNRHIFCNHEEEIAFHFNELNQAKEHIQRLYPDLRVIPVLADIGADGTITFLE